LEHFQSYRGAHDLDLSGINLAVLSGPNGAGKSSIIDAMRYALWGYARAGADSVITEGENVGRVEFEFALGDDDYLVSRQRNRKGGGGTTLSFQIANPDGPGTVVLDGKTVNETQQRIEQVIHMTDDLFVHTACANQGNAAAFSQARPADRKRVLGEILDLETWERRAEAARQAARELQVRIEQTNRQIEADRAEAALAAEIEAALREIAAAIAAAQAKRLEEQQAIGDATEAKQHILAEREAAKGLQQQIQDVQRRRQEAEAAAESLRGRLRSLETAIAERPQIMSTIEVAAAAENVVASLEKLRQQDQELAHEEQLIRERMQAAQQQWETEHRALQAAIAAARREYANKVATLEHEISHIREVHLHRVAQLDDQHERLAGQAEVLDQVPCANPLDEAIRPSFFAIRDKCPLIAQAREAVAHIGAVYADLTAAQAAMPWAEKQAEMESLRAAEGNVAAQERARLAEMEQAGAGVGLEVELAAVGQRRANLGYSSAEHDKAKRQASQRADLQERLRGIDVAAAQKAEVEASLAQREADARGLSDREKELAAQVGDPRRFDKMLAQVEAAIQTARAGIERYDREIAELQGRQGRDQAHFQSALAAAERAQAREAEIAEHQKRLQLLELLGNPRSGAFSRSGIPALLIDKAVPDLEAAANEVLGELSDGRMTVALRSQRETQAKTLSETLAIIVANDRGERPYETFSGGEAMRVDLGLRIGLSRLLAARAGASCELLVLDETAAPLDVEGRRLFVECLDRVAQHFACVLCITHVEELKDLFPARIEVTKDVAGSRMEVLR
jgi:exonuclease SbcC